jgi:hypothetical protein
MSGSVKDSPLVDDFGSFFSLYHLMVEFSRIYCFERS